MPFHKCRLACKSQQALLALPCEHLQSMMDWRLWKLKFHADDQKQQRHKIAIQKGFKTKDSLWEDISQHIPNPRMCAGRKQRRSKQKNYTCASISNDDKLEAWAVIWSYLPWQSLQGKIKKSESRIWLDENLWSCSIKRRSGIQRENDAAACKATYRREIEHKNWRKHSRHKTSAGELKTEKSVQQKKQKNWNNKQISSIGTQKKLRNSVDREVEIQAL